MTLSKWSKWTTYRPRLNFLSIHYTGIIGLALIGSLILSVDGSIRYIDALFLTCGAATQSGLNTVDLNKLRTYQQLVLYIIPNFSNPITINAIIVLFRLYWFEKKLDSLVKDARLGRWNTATKGRNEASGFDGDREERGVAGRPITVLLNGNHPPGLRGTALVDAGAGTGQDSNSPSPGNKHTPVPSPRTSTDNRLGNGHVDLEKASLDPRNLPQNADESTLQSDREATTTEGENNLNPHIAFVETQHPPKRRTGVLRIPSPREFERGGVVEDIEEEESNTLKRSATAGDAPNEEPSIPGRIRRRMGSFSERIIPRSQTLDRAISTAITLRGRSTSPMSRLSRRISRSQDPPMPYLSYTPTVGRNSAFIDLTDDQREELGGLEYRALRLLAKILIVYYIFFHLFGILSILPWIYKNPQYGKVVQDAGVGRPWWAVFTAGSAFMDLGFTLTPDSMVSFQHAVWPLLVMGFLIIIGNTAFPCMLRLIIWLMWKLAPRGSSVEAPLRFLLDHPRRCFTLLFPAGATWVLFGILVLLNGADLILFLVLDLRDKDVMSIPVGYRIVDGFFQAASTRTAGLAVVNLGDLHPAIQVSYMVMMYISVFPIAISVRRTNVYEESALGIYLNEEEIQDTKNANFIGAHLRNQLQYDLWYIFLGLFLIAIAEGSKVESSNGNAFTLFAVLFEVVSAYGTVGLSFGYPGANTSFSGQFTTFSKLVIIAMQIRGRHRGLPYQVDRAIMLPSESLLRDRHLRRRPSFVTTGLPFARSISRISNGGPNMYRSRSGETNTTRAPHANVAAQRPDENTAALGVNTHED